MAGRSVIYAALDAMEHAWTYREPRMLWSMPGPDAVENTLARTMQWNAPGPEHMPERMPKRMSEYMPDRMPEKMPDRMSE